MQKICNKCLKTLPYQMFSKRAASNDGFNYTCRACSAERARLWREQHPGAFSKWHKENSSRRSEYWKQWYEKNKDSRLRYLSIWSSNNKSIVNSIISKRRAIKKKAMPSWANKAKISEFYARAAELTNMTGIRHEVDHYYPLQGKLVCGLHCEANLQILTKTENIRKHNRMPEEVL